MYSINIYHQRQLDKKKVVIIVKTAYIEAIWKKSLMRNQVLKKNEQSFGTTLWNSFSVHHRLQKQFTKLGTNFGRHGRHRRSRYCGRGRHRSRCRRHRCHRRRLFHRDVASVRTSVMMFWAHTVKLRSKEYHRTAKIFPMDWNSLRANLITIKEN